MSRGVRIRSFSNSDVKSAAELHGIAFPNFFLTFLGGRFLRQFYRAFVGNSAAVALAAETDDGALCGVIVGTLTPAGFYRRLLLRRWFVFAVCSVQAVIREPSIAKRLVRALKYRGGAPEGSNRALLSSIAVDPQYRGVGVGGMLIDEWCAELRRRGLNGAYLTTDADGNAAVNRFYQNHGWQLESAFTTPEGRKMNRYIYDFAKK